MEKKKRYMRNMAKEKEMTKEEKPEFEKYAYANLAAQLASSEKDSIYVSGALKLLRKNIDLGKDGGVLYEHSYTSEEGIKNLINIYNSAFGKELSKAKPNDLMSWYGGVALKGTTEEQAKLFKSEFAKITEDYGTIMQKVISANHTLEGVEKGVKVSKEDQEKAQKITEKYGNFLKIQKTLNGYAFEGMRQKAVEASKESVFGGLEKSLKEEKK